MTNTVPVTLPEWEPLEPRRADNVESWTKKEKMRHVLDLPVLVLRPGTALILFAMEFG
jgi:hypothetical protein